jgi:CHAT domain-containing protein
MTPPATATSLDDGYLSASEAAQLKLDADWVLLSACNTAASDGTPDAEGLSGLANGFLYAGARALLVSHWRVSSEATTKLVAETIAAYARSPQAGKAMALRTAMLAVMGKPEFAHPYYWAAFSVIGD